MAKVIVNDAPRTLLPNLDRRIAFCDESGRTLGHFVPEGEYKQMLAAWMGTDISEEELARRSAEPGGQTLAEICKDLGRAGD